MTREKEIDVAATHYDYGYNTGSRISAYCCFRDGAEWADKNPKLTWISVKDDLPCNHKELMATEIYTKKIIVYLNDGRVRDTIMFLGKWKEYGRKITHWKFIELPE